MSARLDWNREGSDWPNRSASQFVEAGGLRWHVQIAGRGPVMVLLHGTGASTHSWRDLLPVLATDFRVIAPDLPGHGFTDTPERDALSLPGMSRSIGQLLGALGETPDCAVGHSAGGAIILRMALDRVIAPATIIGLNAALRPFGGGTGRFSRSMARLFAMSPFVPHFFAWQAGEPAAIRGLIEGTGSNIDARGLALYQRLFRSRAHVQATISMMANWDLEPLQAALGRIEASLHLVAAASDKAVSPEDARQFKSRVPSIHLHIQRKGGHLVHEEHPLEIAALIRNIAAPASMRQAG